MSVAEVESAEANVSNPAETCPRCHTTQSWGHSSWCPQCNYYPVVDSSSTDGSSWADDLPEMPQEEVEDGRTALESIPSWFWIMLGGIVGIAGFSVAVRLMFPEDDGPRGMVALVQLSTGLVSMLAAHGIASRLALKSDRRINFNDVVLSWFNIWQPTITRLPQTCKRVWALVWGAIATLTAVTIIGGIDYSAPFRTHTEPEVKPLNIIGKVAAAARAGAVGKKNQSMAEALADLKSQVEEAEALNGGGLPGGPQSMEEALNQISDIDEKLNGIRNNLDADGNPIEHVEVRHMECYIYGVVVNSKNIPTTFLYAANTSGKGDQHVAAIKTEDLPRDKFRLIAVKLYKEVQSQPEIETLRKAIWVKPVVTCRLSFTGFTEAGELKEAKFDAIVVNQRGSMDAKERQSKSSTQRR